MAQRHAKTTTRMWSGRTTFLLAILFVIQVWVPTGLSEGADLDDMEICSNPIGGLGGDCDGRTNADDGTTGVTQWVDGVYDFNMTSPTEIEFEASWAIREWDKSGLGIFSGAMMENALGADNIGPNDGLPADVLRAAFDNNTDPNDPASPTVKQTLLSEVNGSISQLLSTWGGASTPQTDWADSIMLPNSSGSGGFESVECTTDVAKNGEGPDNDGDGASDSNAFEPPICITTSVVISLNILETYGLSGVSASNLEAALEGMLIMGSQVTTKFDVSVNPGHRGTYSIQPPPYATVTVAGGTYGETVNHVEDGYHSGLWIIDWRNPSGALSSQSFNGHLDMTMGFRQSSNTGVVSVLPDDKSIDVRIVVDMSDESNTFVEVEAAIYQIQSSSLDQWGVPPIMDKDKAIIPVITSDGIRMAYHTGLLQLDHLSENIPISGIGEAIGGANQNVVVQMGDFVWTSNAQQQPGGLNMTHMLNCLRGVHYCLEGTVAMDDTYPVIMSSVSNTFPMSLADLLGGNLGDAGFMNSVTGDDLSILLNSGVEFSTILSDEDMESFIGEMLPSGMSTDLTMEIVLPSWASTKDGSTSIEMTYRASGTHDAEVSLTGAESFFWNHAICSESTGSACTDTSPDRVCESSLKSCAYVDVGLDISEISSASILISKGVTVEFELSINLTVHRIAVPDSLFDSINTDSTNLSLDVLPSDLIRLLLEIGSRGDPLEWGFSICDTGMSYCDQSIPLSNDNRTGLPGFGTSFSQGVKSYITDETRSLSSDADNNFGNLDMSEFSLELSFPYDGLIDEDDPVTDEKGIVMSLKIPRVSVTMGLDNSWADLISMAGGEEGDGLQIGIATESPTNTLVVPFLEPMVSAMEGLTGALAGSLVSGDGVRPAPNMSVGVGASALSGIGGDEMGINLGGSVTLTLPLGIQLEDISSEQGQVSSEIDAKTQRQTITYEIEPGMGDDTLEFTLLLTPTWVLQQLVYYILVFVIFFFWRVTRRGRKRRKRRRAQALQALEDSAVSPIGYIPPTPTVEVVQVAENGIVVKKRLSPS